ncbi:glycyl-radical enzyme activating protein [Breznakiella homolactica]|uniref:Glycyl-radical enzyme activating protein n=1 Tax=Breznakiella homolactica TaxID=2798577 RepID=A0A7T7XS78_9SPIR|nr:glycyl-radical enzyme activating protein [Breznakiella homolactica]
MGADKGLVFDIQRWSIHDGPGVRTVVFLKGCPMRCNWCCNPESQNLHNELVFFKDKCIGCHRCVSLCPHGAVTLEDGRQAYNRKICRETCYKEGLNVFPCTKQCYAKAIRAVAELKTVDEVIREVMKDELMYQKSRVGGLTLSGGEASMQDAFAYSLLERAKSLGITTAMETCGIASWEVFEKLLNSLDYLFLDIKLFDNELHKTFMGTGNELVLSNAVEMSKLMDRLQKDFTVRIPVIPTVSSLPDFRNILDFVKGNLSPQTSVEIMPYHRLGRGKYEDLGIEYSLTDLEPCTEESLKPYRELLASYQFKEI